MKILQVQEYNRIKEIEWSEAMSKHKYYTQADFYTCPQLAFYCFFTNQGEYRKTGYIAFEKHCAVWGRTKREAIAKFKE